MSDRNPLPRQAPGRPTAAEQEAAALKMVTDQQTRIAQAAIKAFGDERDPIRIFAETVASSSVIHVNAMILLQRGVAERHLHFRTRRLPPGSPFRRLARLKS